MNAELLFSIASNVALLPWLLMVFAPKWKWTRWFINSLLLVVLFAAAYVTILFATFSLDNFSGQGLAGIRQIFEDDYALLAGWLHYLAFDLMVGSWIFNDARKRDVNHFILIPCLFFTLMTGPFGLFLYLLVRLLKERHWLVDENFGLARQ